MKKRKKQPRAKAVRLWHKLRIRTHYGHLFWFLSTRGNSLSPAEILRRIGLDSSDYGRPFCIEVRRVRSR